MRLFVALALPMPLLPTIAKSSRPAPPPGPLVWYSSFIASTLDTIELNEPTPYVRRFTDFATDFRTELDAALSLPPDLPLRQPGATRGNWDRIAELTMDGYRCATSTSSVAWLRIVEAQGWSSDCEKRADRGL